MTAQSSSSTSFPAAPQWEAVGAWQGGTVTAVALAQTRAESPRGPESQIGVLASGAGAYAWTLPGATLIPLTEGLSDLNIVTVAVAAADGSNRAFAATATGRLFQIELTVSEVAAEWQEISAWAGLGLALVLAPSPAFAADRTLFVGTPNGIYRTQDGGQHWESCNFGLLDEDVLCMACAPDFATSEMLWAGTAGGGLYRSRNSGRAWRESGYGLPDAAVQSLAVSPDFAADRTLYAGLEGAGVYASRDGGEEWQPLALAGHSVNSLACAQAGTLWAGTEDGLWRVQTMEGTAEQVAAAGEVVMSVAASEQGQVAMGLYGSGVWLAAHDDGAANRMVWQQPALALHAPPVVTHVGDVLYAHDASGQMAHSLDGGANWSSVAGGLPALVFALHGSRNGTIDNAGDSVGHTTLFAATERGLARWDEHSDQWQFGLGAQMGETLDETLGTTLDVALGVDVSPTFGDDRTLLVMGDANDLYLSADGGKTLQAITGPWDGQNLLTARFAPWSANEVIAITVRATDSGHFALTVWESHDQGTAWDTLAGLNSGVPAVVLAWPHDTDERAIFLATQHRVIKLYQAGTPPALQVHQHFFDEHVRVTALAVAPDYALKQIIWAATSEGLYRSVDRGLTWALILDLPQSLPVVSLHVGPTHVSAITLGGRVWRAAL